jgi:hypothetical protein
MEQESASEDKKEFNLLTSVMHEIEILPPSEKPE